MKTIYSGSWQSLLNRRIILRSEFLSSVTQSRIKNMGDILPFKKKTPFEKHKGKSLCRSGFHKWVVVKEKQFDVKQGKLVSVYKCERCGEQKVEAR
jgi:hypothetical protein